jgi:tetrahydromethanopterin S-methyltransferase subunit C
VLDAAFIALLIAVLLGSVLAVLHMREDAVAPPWPFGALHAAIALAGLACLGFALRGPPRGADQGAASFGMIAAGLFVLAALLGLTLIRARRRFGRLPGPLIGFHATLAIGGFVVLLAYVLA